MNNLKVLSALEFLSSFAITMSSFSQFFLIMLCILRI